MEDYQFLRQIGQGKYGEIWLVKCSKTRKKYVLKSINLQNAPKWEQRAAREEAKLLSTVNHPNIVKYMDSFYNSKGCLFIIMGYCECGDLYTLIRKQNGMHFPERQIIYWFVQICMGLKHLHDKNILHRDLKTKNIFLTKNKLIKLGDLGIARVLCNNNEMSTTVVGTPLYMSPEIFAGKSYSYKSDIWALGCCIYEIASLKQAFNAHDIYSLIQKVMKGKISSIPTWYSSELLTIVQSMLNHDPEKRPSVSELLLNDFVIKYIQRFLESTPVRSQSTDTSPKDKAVDNEIQRSKSISDLQLAASEDIEYEESMTEAMITTPDVNGNGDANDNSRQRLDMKEHELDERDTHIDDTKTSPEENPDSKSNEIKPSEATAPKLNSNDKESKLSGSFKENISPQENHHDPTSKNTKKEKTGQNSFKLLNNLTYTIKNNRFICLENYANGPEIRCVCGMSPPETRKSSESKNRATNLLLPQIRASKNKESHTARRRKCLQKLPVLKHVEDKIMSDEQILGKLGQTGDFSVDKALLEKIMQKGQSNSPARQRRREVQKQKATFSSLPTTLKFTVPKVMERNLVKVT